MNLTRRSNVSLGLRFHGALLAIAVVTIHVADQGGISNFTDPDWLGWAYRLIEVGGLATAATLLLAGGLWLTWLPAALVGIGPFLGYLASRTVGVPMDNDDIGNWSDWVGTTSLLIEAALIVLAIGVLTRSRAKSCVAATRGVRDTRSNLVSDAA